MTSDGDLLVAVHTVQDETTRAMGLAREVTNRVQVKGMPSHESF